MLILDIKIQYIQQMSQIILDPMAILEMSTYYQKNIIRKMGATVGLLYAQQVELNFRICISTALGTDQTKTDDIISRVGEYETLRLKRSKNTVNYYEEYTLIGWYIMGSLKYTSDEKKIQKISQQLQKRDAPYLLLVDPEGFHNPKLFRSKEPCPYLTEMEPTQKICIDSMHMQASKDITTLQKTILKSKNVINVFTEKIEQLKKMLKKDISAETRRKILEILDNYERIEYENQSKKKETIEAINYSLLTGIVLDKIVKNQ